MWLRSVWVGLCLLGGSMANAGTLLEVHQGLSSFYHATGAGSCGFETSPHDLMVAAVNSQDYGNGNLCGVYLRITGPRGAALVRVVDRCSGCKPGGLDLSKQAFAKVADPKKGRDTVHWQIASPDLDGPLQYHFKAGSSPHWLGIQLRNHRNPISTLEYRAQDGQWHHIPRGTHNYFVNKDPAIGAGPYTLRVTDIYGNQIIDHDIPLRAGSEVASATQLPDYVEAAHLASGGGRWLSEDESNNMDAPATGSGRWKPVTAGTTQDAEQVASRWRDEGNQHVPSSTEQPSISQIQPANTTHPHDKPALTEDNMAPEATRWLAETPPETPATDDQEPNDEGQTRWASRESTEQHAPAADQTDAPGATADKAARAATSLDDLLAQKANH